MVPGSGPAAGVVHLALPAAGSSPSRARRFASGHLRGWDLAACEDAVLLLVSELVTNALLHARTDMVVALSHDDDCVLLEVSDHSTQRPTARNYSVHAGTGRGLQLVETLARTWGVRLENGGKTVWAQIAAHPNGDETLMLFDIDAVEAL